MKTISMRIEYLAVTIIIGIVAYSTTLLVVYLIFKTDTHVQTFHEYKYYLGKALLLGLEILVAADVICMAH